MAIPKTVLGEVIDELPGEEVEATIGDPRWVMSTLAGLYSNNSLAVIREYSTNARDANVEAGRGDIPIEITLPSQLTPQFVVKDTGVGMSYEELKQTYLAFGNSTKRESNAYNGMLGFGSKSAVAYTTSFTVSSIKDGLRTDVAISKRPDSSIFMKIMGGKSFKTDEPNGTTVTVPVHNIGEFRQVAADFYRFWTVPILVDGKEPSKIIGEELQEGMYISSNGESYVVMGNVPYHIKNPSALFTNRKVSSFAFVLYVKNGEVEFTPAREALEYSELTKKTLHRYIGDFETGIIAKAQKDIDGADTKWEALARYRKWSSSIGSGVLSELKFKGEAYPHTINFTGVAREAGSWGMASTAYYYYPNNAHKAFFVRNCPLRRIGSVQNGKVKSYFHGKGISTMNVDSIYYLAGDEQVSDWVNPERVVEWADVVKFTRPAYGSSGTRTVKTTEEYRTYYYVPGAVMASGQQQRGYWVDNDVDFSTLDEKKVVYIGAADAKDLQTPKRRGSIRDFLAHMDDKDIKVVIIGANRMKKFLTKHPKVLHFKDWARANIVTDLNTFYNDDERMASSVPGATSNWLNRLDLSKVDDPEVHHLAKIVKGKPVTKPEANSHAWMAKFMNLPIKHMEKMDVPDITNMYPLLGQMYYSNRYLDDVYYYMNGRYAATKKEEEKDD